MYINKRGVAVAVLGVALLAAGGWYARGPAYLSNPVVTAQIYACRGKPPHVFCLGRWPAGHGNTHHGVVDGVFWDGHSVKVRPKDDHSATTKLHLTATDWVARELVAALLVGGGVACGVLLYRRRRRYRRENPDELPSLARPDPA